MVTAQRATVRPRVLLPQSGEALPLEDEILSLVEARAHGIVQIVGPPGSGKTTALQHLAAVLPRHADVVLVDGDGDQLVQAKARRLLVWATTNASKRSTLATYRLAPWGPDERLEYLLARHSARCGAVLPRLRAVEQGRPVLPTEVWCIVLDQMAVDDSVQTFRHAVERYLRQEFRDEKDLQNAQSLCFLLVVDPGRNITLHELANLLARLGLLGASATLLRAICHEAVQVVLAAQHVVTSLLQGKATDCFYHYLSRTLVGEIAALAAREAGAPEALRALLAEEPAELQSIAASILHATDTGWVPERSGPTGRLPHLAGAYLQSAAWPSLDLLGARLAAADLSQAYLRGAILDQVSAVRTIFREAQLQGARLRGFVGRGADLTGADLGLVKAEGACFDGACCNGAKLDEAVLRAATFVGASLVNASFSGADLTEAILTGAVIREADFAGANLEKADLSKLCLRESNLGGARFAEAVLAGCDLEHMHFPGGDFRRANLRGAYLTGCMMAEAMFDCANLQNAGLAEIDWEGASLRGADLRGASFHLGSTRSGLVGSPMPCEGSRTGFYTDDAEEQTFKAPEEIRKANLRGADLRGARLDSTDFYLVDLRDALYDPEHEEHFRRCGAILEAHV
jgi:uncharacterized protein YjbI with pentapeptide repeats/energy-coupling factor transporter ATP-binding protein EcfA2